MGITVTPQAIDNIVNAVKLRSDINLKECYQCGKCSAGCPMAFQMDYPPNQLIRLAQLGQRNIVLTSKTIWVCVSCITCTARCPKNIEIADLMDVFREMSLKERLATPEQKNIQIFHKAFLETVRSTGRLYEVGLIRKYKLRTLKLFQDIGLVPKMLFSGKLKFLPHKIENTEAIDDIFKKCSK